MNSSNHSTDAQRPLLSERAQILLKTLIEKYIEDGQPVASKTLVTDSGLNVSSATVRHVMADLEKLGLLKSPHTSAGRVPTDLGYRIFVDSLVSVKPVNQSDSLNIEQQLLSEDNAKKLALSATDLLSGITSMASIILLPKRNHNAFRHIEFLPLSDNRVLAINVINECDVENRIIQTNRAFSAQELEKVANYLNTEFVGKDIQTVRDNLLTDLHQAKQEVNTFMTSLLEMADRLFPESPMEEELLVSGKTNLLAYQEMGDTEKLRQLFEAFKGKKDILEILDQCLLAKGVQIYIGAETGNNCLEECSIVTSPYSVDGKIVGVLGVVGPTRMSYDKVIPIVDITAKLYGSALQNKQ
ncbi:MAG TPA: heat-inducible transcription repressor HrcA [Gammaproteobacteria bacterium]|nr:heat-inducible transcription repressor HrcA [Gammaproteobacteria bacterium]